MNIKQIIANEKIDLDKNINLLEFTLLNYYFKSYLEKEGIKIEKYNYQQTSIIRKLIVYGITKENFFNYKFNNHRLTYKEFYENFIKYINDVKEQKVKKDVLYFIEDYLIDYKEDEKELITEYLEKDIDVISILFLSKNWNKTFLEFTLICLKNDFIKKIENLKVYVEDPNTEIKKGTLISQSRKYKPTKKVLIKQKKFFKELFINNDVDIFNKEILTFVKNTGVFKIEKISDAEFIEFLDVIYFEIIKKHTDLKIFINKLYLELYPKISKEKEEVKKVLLVSYCYINKYEIDSEYTLSKLITKKNENKKIERKQKYRKSKKQESSYLYDVSDI